MKQEAQLKELMHQNQYLSTRAMVLAGQLDEAQEQNVKLATRTQELLDKYEPKSEMQDGKNKD